MRVQKGPRARPWGLGIAIILLLTGGAVTGETPAARWGHQETVRAVGVGNPWINLRDGHEVVAAISRESLERGLSTDAATEALTLATADFDEDGVPDLLCGLSTYAGGVLSLYRGNVDSIYPNSLEASRRRLAGTFTEVPLLGPVHWFPLPVVPSFLAAGDFDNDGNQDAIAAASDDDGLYLLAGDGRGGLGAARRIPLAGRVTALAAADLGRRDGLIDLAVGVDAAAGSQLLVFMHRDGAFAGAPMLLNVPAPVTDMAAGQLDGHHAIDLALAADTEVLIIHAGDWDPGSIATRAEDPAGQMNRLVFPSSVSSIALGDFVPGEAHELELAVLLADGELRFVDPGSGESKARHQSGIVLAEPGRVPLKRVKVSSLPGDDLVLIDPHHQRLQLVVPAQRKSGVTAGADSTGEPGPWSVNLDAAGDLVEVLPMRLNPDALNDLVVLRRDSISPSIALTAPIRTFTVNSTAWTQDGDPRDDICDTGNNQVGLTGICTLAAALTQASWSAGAERIDFGLGPGTPAIPAPRGAVIGPVTILGNTGGSTRVEIRGSPNGGTSYPDYGLRVTGGSGTLRSLVINGFDGGKMWLYGDTGGNIVEDCYLGLDASGKGAPGPDSLGIRIHSPGNIIGGTTEQARNVISGNSQCGVVIHSPGNRVQGNYIGTDASGSAPVRNDGHGLSVEGTNNTIGGTSERARNVISGNSGSGIVLSSASLVQGNYIGTTESGGPLGNATGVEIKRRCGSSTVGGTANGAGNVVAFNTGEWHRLTDQPYGGVTFSYCEPQCLDCTGNRIQRNSIYGNRSPSREGLGIDIYPIGPNENDSGDHDGAGCNRLQNHPIITTVNRSYNDAVISGTLNSTPSTSFEIEFFSSHDCDPSGYGEGNTFLGSAQISTDPNGNATFKFHYQGAVKVVTATATDADGNTSEFSPCSFPIVVNSDGDGPDRAPSDGRCDTGVLTAAGEPECTLRAAIQTANAVQGINTVAFNIPGGPPVIRPKSALPTVSQPIFMNGQSHGSVIRIVVDGANAVDETSGLEVTAPNSSLRGLIIRNFPGYGVRCTASNLELRKTQVLDNGNIGVYMPSGALKVVNTVTANFNAKDKDSCREEDGGVHTEGPVTGDHLEVTGNCGSGLFAKGSVNLKEVIARSNTHYGINAGSDLTIRGGEGDFYDNGHGGVYVPNGAVVIREKAQFTYNGRVTRGSGIYARESITLADVESLGNGGAGIVSSEGSISTKSAKVLGNGTSGIFSVAGEIHIDGGQSEISHNGGPGISAPKGQVEIKGSAKVNGNNLAMGCGLEEGAAGIFGTSVVTAEIESIGNCRYGISSSAGDVQIARARIMRNVGHGIWSQGDVIVGKNSDVSLNGTGAQAVVGYDHGIYAPGGLVEMQEGSIRSNKGYGVYAARVRLSGVAVIGNVRGGVYAQFGRKKRTGSPWASRLLAEPILNVIEESSLSYNLGDGVRTEAAAQLRVNMSTVQGNYGYGVRNLDTTATLDAADNWWGDASGPGGSGPGSGDEVSEAVDFTPWRTSLPWRLLEVAKVGSGSVTSSPGGINCGTDCQESYPDKAVVRLEATPDLGFEFTAWGGDEDCAEGAVFMAEDRACTATFDTCTLPSSVSLPAQVVSSYATFEACNILQAVSSFRIQAPGNVVFRASHLIVLGNDFEVGSGAVFRAVLAGE